MSKALSPVGKVMLIFLITLIGIAAFQMFARGHITEFFDDIMGNSAGPQDRFKVDVLRITGDTLYVKNGNSVIITTDELRINGQVCKRRPSFVPGTLGVDVSDCLPNEPGSVEIVIVTEVGVINERVSVS